MKFIKDVSHVSVRGDEVQQNWFNSQILNPNLTITKQLQENSNKYLRIEIYLTN